MRITERILNTTRFGILTWLGKAGDALKYQAKRVGSDPQRGNLLCDIFILLMVSECIELQMAGENVGL